MRPVARGLIHYDKLLQEDLLDLEDFAIMNDALDAQDENEYRARKAWEAKNKEGF